MGKLSGIIVPAVTPFDENGNISFSALEFNYDKWKETPVAGFMCLGSNGEFRMLSDDEALDVIRVSSEKAGERTFIAGIGRESLYQTLKFMERVNKLKTRIDYYSVLTPSYFKGRMTDEALIDYYTEIADASPIPVLLYCAPAFANEVTISKEAVAALADHPNIHGIKDTSKNMLDSYMDAVGGRSDFEVVSGSMSTLMKCLDRGGKGGVVSAANYFPAECCEVVRLYNEEGREAAMAYYEKIKELISKTGARGSVAGVKCTMNLVGLKGMFPRKPVLPISEEEERSYREALAESGRI